MATVKLLGDEELSSDAMAVFDDIKAARKSEFVNNFWRRSPTIPRRSGEPGTAFKT
jgi:hypothetical protein